MSYEASGCWCIHGKVLRAVGHTAHSSASEDRHTERRFWAGMNVGLFPCYCCWCYNVQSFSNFISSADGRIFYRNRRTFAPPTTSVACSLAFTTDFYGGAGCFRWWWLGPPKPSAPCTLFAASSQNEEARNMQWIRNQLQFVFCSLNGLEFVVRWLCAAFRVALTETNFLKHLN